MLWTIAVYPPFPVVVSALFCSRCSWWKTNFYFCHVLRSADCCLRSHMPSLKIPVCAKRVITLYIIMESEIFWPPALANSLPFSKCSISPERGSVGSYGLIILIAFYLRLIYPIAPYLENRCFIMVSADTCTNPVRWFTSGDSNTGSTVMTICFFKALSTLMYLWNSASFCRNFSGLSACY